MDLLTNKCDYSLSGISNIYILPISEFDGYVYRDKENYMNSCCVTDILRYIQFIEVSAPIEVAKYKGVDGYTHTVESFVSEFSAEKNSYLHSALTERFVILFRLNTDKFYTFGADGGAAIGIEKQTQDGAGYKLTFTAKSKYPLFEVDNNVLDRVGFVSFWYREDWVSCVQSNGVATGFLQAERMMKVSKKGDKPVDIDGRLCEFSAKKQAAGFLWTSGTPAHIDKEGTYRDKEYYKGFQTSRFAPEICPIGELFLSPAQLDFCFDSRQKSFNLTSKNNWFIQPQDGNPNTQLFTFSLRQGGPGSFTITVKVKMLDVDFELTNGAYTKTGGVENPYIPTPNVQDFSQYESAPTPMFAPLQMQEVEQGLSFGENTQTPSNLPPVPIEYEYKRCANLIEIQPDIAYFYTGLIKQNSNYAGVVYFDENQQFISYQFGGGNYVECILSIPENAKYIGVCAYNEAPILQKEPAPCDAYWLCRDLVTGSNVLFLTTYGMNCLEWILKTGNWNNSHFWVADGIWRYSPASHDFDLEEQEGELVIGGDENYP